MIYFDNSATTQIYPEALETYVKTSQQIMGNPSSLHALGNQAQHLLMRARQQIAALLQVADSEIYFTSGGTEGNNWILKGTAHAKRQYGKHVIISAVEHPSVTEAAQQLVAEGFDLSVLPVNQQGFVDLAALKTLIRSDTILVSVMAVNNEIGVVQPLRAISELLQPYPTIHFHVDAVQALGKVPQAQWLTERVDFATFSAHKFHGPKGVGFVYWKKGKQLAPLLAGGGQESNRRSGTENVPGIAATAKALRLYLEQIEIAHLEALKRTLLTALKQYPKVTVFSEDDPQLFAPHILCFGMQGIKGEVFVHALEEAGIFVSTTSACSSKKANKNSTLYAMHVPQNLAQTAVRISLASQNTAEEIAQFLLIFDTLYQKFSSLSRG